MLSLIVRLHFPGGGRGERGGGQRGEPGAAAAARRAGGAAREAVRRVPQEARQDRAAGAVPPARGPRHQRAGCAASPARAAAAVGVRRRHLN